MRDRPPGRHPAGYWRRRPGQGTLRPVRRPAVVLLVGALLAAAGIWAAAPAQACDCSGGTTTESADWADAVFTGRLVDSRDGPPGRWGNVPTVLVFAVDTVVKGEVLEQQEIVTSSDSGSCGVLLTGSGPFAVFGTRADDVSGLFTLESDQYAVNQCDGTGALTPTIQAELDALPDRLPGIGPASAPADVPDDRTGPVLAGIAGVAALGVATLLLLRRRRHRDVG